jgi:ribosome-binding protein aMBF1 (putative translation factor)
MGLVISAMDNNDEGKLVEVSGTQTTIVEQQDQTGEHQIESAQDVARRERWLVVQDEILRWDHVAAVVFTATHRDLGISQERLANAVGWTRNMIANMVSGRRSMKVSELIVLASALGVPPENLLSRILHWGRTSRS